MGFCIPGTAALGAVLLGVGEAVGQGSTASHRCALLNFPRLIILELGGGSQNPCGMSRATAEL